MSYSAILKEMINDGLKNLHVAFIAKILSVNGNKAKIQPLGLIKENGTATREQSPLTNVHIADSARYKTTTKDITYVYNSDGDRKVQTVAVPTPIKKGDIVLCVCCDRNIDAALKGENSMLPAGYHSKSDCVIVAII